MKNFLWTIILIITVSVTGICQKDYTKTKNSNIQDKENIKKCSDNSDKLYERQDILNQLAKILNSSIPEYSNFRKTGFYVNDDGRGIGFFVYDLTDTSNKETTLKDCVEFKDNHIYHFAPIRNRYSFSHIVILEDRNLKVFKSINCKGKGDSLEDVISYLNKKLKEDKNKGAILNRVKNYRKYGVYTTVDTPTPECK